MSDLLRQSVNGTSPPRPRPTPISIAESDETSSSSDSSTSSADSAASINTVRPSSREQEPPQSHWTHYFAQEIYLNHEDEHQKANYHAYLTPPTDPQKGPLFICIHGAGSTALTFALFWQALKSQLPTAGILALDLRCHGSTTITSPTHPDVEITDDFSLATLSADCLRTINLTLTHQTWPQLPPTILIGHSLGGAITTHLASTSALGRQLVGYTIIDVVEGSAVEALAHMTTYLSSRPHTFPTQEAAMDWHIRSRTLRNRVSAQASVPSLLIPSPSPTNPETWTWRTDLKTTTPFWPSWFTHMSSRFLSGQGAKQLILAGTDRLDKELMIGQMQGKFQLVVVPEAGHFVQEDVPEKVAGLVGEFWRRNDRGAMVLPPKVSDLIKQGKKV